MNIKDILNTAHSKKNSDYIINCVLNDDTKIVELMECFFSKDLRLCQRASYAVGMISGKKGELLQRYMPLMIRSLDKSLHNALTRNIVRVWQNMDIHDDFASEIFERCFNYINDSKEAIAVRAFSIEVCLKICKKFPELKFELIEILPLHYENGSPGLKHKIKKAIKELS